MIKFNPNKNKKLSFDILVEGIDPNLLEYKIRLTDGEIEYGFTCENKQGEIVVDIPALNTFLNEKSINSLTKIKMEINDSNNKYYLKPFEDEILIEREPELKVTVKEEINEEQIKVDVKEADDIEEKKCDKKKKSILRDKLEN